MRIALDVDGVILDYGGAFKARMRHVMGRIPDVRRDCYSMIARYGLNDAEAARVQACFDEPGAWGNLPVITPAVEAARRLEALGHEVSYVTGVPESRAGERRQQLAKLRLHGNVIAAHASFKEAVFRSLAVDVVVDDDPVCVRAAISAGVPLVFHVPTHGCDNNYIDDPKRLRLLLESVGQVHSAPDLASVAFHLIPTVIGLRGAKGAGKDTLASILVAEHGFRRLAFGDAMKDEVAEQYGIEAARLHDQKIKNECRAPDGRLWRQELQDHASRQRRENPHYWVEKVLSRLLEPPSDESNLIVISDVRDRHEVALVHAFGGKVWQVRRLLAEQSAAADSHEAEHYLDAMPADREVYNIEGDLEPLRRSAAVALASGEDVPTGRLLFSRLAALPTD